MVHVDAAWKEVDGPGHGLDDGIPEFVYNDIAEIYRKLCEVLGSDLTIPTLGNPLWHTGNAVPNDGGAGAYRWRMPWLWIWEVALGRSTGKGRADSESAHWRKYVRDWLNMSVFRM